MKRENKGITLIALVITVTVLIILASVATYSGVGIIRQSKLNRFTTEMKIMQTEVNDLYQKATSGETVEVNGNSYSGLDIYNIGKELDSRANNVFTSETSGITDKSGYRLYDQPTIQGLGIEGVEEEYFVNVEKRSIASCSGFEYEGETYYTLEQLPNGLYNAQYEENTNKPTFDVSMEKLDDGTFRMTISNIQYNGYIDKWQVKYQKEGQDYWSTSEDLSFIVPDIGPYNVKIENGDVASDVKITQKSLVRKWVSKIDGNGEEEFLDVEKTSDGGYIAVGYTTSTNISGLTNKGSADCLIAKYDANGNEQWKKSVGGSKYDWYNSVIEITDGTYIAVGTILSTDVVDKNGVNIGHGYDWEEDTQGGLMFGYASMTGTEGLIGTYDSNGNEVSLKVTGKATDKYYGSDFKDWAGGTSAINVKLQSINKMSDGNYIITGKKTIGELTWSSMTGIMDVPFAIKYDKNGNQLAETESVFASVTNGNVTDYKSGAARYSMWNGVIENNNQYVIWGNSGDKAGSRYDEYKRIRFTSKDLVSISEMDFEYELVKPDVTALIKSFFMDNSNYVVLNYFYSTSFDYDNNDDNGNFERLAKYGEDGSEIWKNTDKVIKSISKSSENDFVGISDDNKFLKYNMDDGSVLEEYDMPTYEDIHAIEGKEEFIFLGTPTDEEGITIEGTSGAVIAKYAIE